ncbi:MAG: hypothetical protein ACR2GY_02375 [Phycisphaerales bacterium]
MSGRAPLSNAAADAMQMHQGAVRTPWRIMFVVYATALTVGTHWPRLDLGTEEYPATDKMLHLYAFAGLATLLWWTGWLKQLRWLFPLVFVWILADEITQSLAILERTFSWADVIAGALGSIVAWAWLWALRDVGKQPNRERLAMQRLAFQSLFANCTPLPASRAAWLLFVVAGVGTGLGLILFWPIVIARLPNPLPGLVYGISMSAFAGVGMLLFQRIWNARLQLLRAQRICHQCGCAVRQDAAGGMSRCESCHAHHHSGTWLTPPAPRAGQVKQMAWLPVVSGLAVLATGAVIAVVAVRAYADLIANQALASGAIRATRFMVRLGTDFTVAIDLAILLLALAAVVRMYRVRLAAWHDAQSSVCRQCRYDLSATAVDDQQLGRCPECGTPFARRASDEAMRLVGPSKSGVSSVHSK